MATKESANLKLTLEDNEEFAGIEVTAENFKKIDEAYGQLHEAAENASKAVTVSVTKNGDTVSANKTFDTLKAEFEKGNEILCELTVTGDEAASGGICTICRKTDTALLFFTWIQSTLWLVKGAASGWEVTSFQPAESGHSHRNATQADPGFLSAEDKTKLDGIATGANKTTVDNALSSTSTNPVQNKVIKAALDGKASTGHTHSGYASSGHTHSDATTSSSGFMSSGDKRKLNGIDSNANNYSLPTASSSTLGGVKVGENLSISSDGTLSAEAGGVGQAGTGTNAEIFNGTYSKEASGNYSHVEGYATTASGECSHAEGGFTTASGVRSHAEGKNTKATGDYSHAEGENSEAKGTSSHAAGINSVANECQTVVGYNNKETEGEFSSQSSTKSIFIVGNGMNMVGSESNALRTAADGQSFGLKAFGASGADFAEYFEWQDGNPNDEDRRGMFVTLDGEKIKLANAGDFIVGVVSSMAAFIGNTSSEQWQGRYLQDVFGDWVQEEVEIPEKTDEVTGEVIPAHTVVQYALNPEYDATQEYVSRQFRKEWSPIGMLGQVVVVDDGTCTVGGFCNAGVDGIGTAAENGYKVMKRIDNTHVKVLVK